ncbi:hypothetical protein FISHEDRAFT_73453 [Fistulina hepatica ATCC 64428]|uniref:Uncharacterized protein n=1 Tax=Fistulina hepatica ATCC 64428 TaxID=1128425 RepID=A0A0D7ACB1_9AGAR|nr:hypothetical protein FISHEDRAFT_73453 [Fistulina hepatica ATCC 64428]
MSHQYSVSSCIYKPRREPTLLLLVALATSLLFTSILLLAFLGESRDKPDFTDLLNEVARVNSGLVLIGENVDIDIDEPSIGFRWSILACGEGAVLAGSAGLHDSECGLPAMPLYIYVDEDLEPSATYDPATIPFSRIDGSRRRIWYNSTATTSLTCTPPGCTPSTPIFSATFRATSFTNESVSIQLIATIRDTSTFVVMTTDVETYQASGSEYDVQPSRDIDVYMTRYTVARILTLALFVLGWLMAHMCAFCAVLVRRVSNTRTISEHVIIVTGLCLVLPQLRQSMVDAPGYDGVLIDSIGFFPQMVVADASLIATLVLLFLRCCDGDTNVSTRLRLVSDDQGQLTAAFLAAFHGQSDAAQLPHNLHVWMRNDLENAKNLDRERLCLEDTG